MLSQNMVRKPLRHRARLRMKQRSPLFLYCIGAVLLHLISRVGQGFSRFLLEEDVTGTSARGSPAKGRRLMMPASHYHPGKPDGSAHTTGLASPPDVDEGSNDCDGISPCISIHVFAYTRTEPVKHLLNTLRASNYSGYAMALPLVVHMDGPATGDDLHKHEALREMLQDFTWMHGPLILDISDKHRGLKDSWLSAWRTPKPDDIMIAFEDDIDVSPHYFQWLLKILKKYNLQQSGARDPSLLGISLSPIRVDEISYPFKPWLTHEKVPSKYPVFLHAVPSSWGAAYFGGPWRDFLSFARIRSARSFYDLDEEALNLTGYGWHTRRGDPNLWLPNSRSNNWVKSWKRFMVEFAYGRGAYTIYPNLAGSSGLATSMFLQGEHVPTGVGRNPRIAPFTHVEDIGPSLKLPAYNELPLKDMHGQDITRAELGYRGDHFLRDLAGLGPKYADLISTWRRPCLLDIASVQGYLHGEQAPAPVHAPQPMDPGYLLVHPQMGFSNQLIAIMHSAVWAHTLRRKLVLPHIFWPRVSSESVAAESWISFHEVFDASGISKHLPGLEFVHADSETLAKWRPQRLVGIEPKPTFDKLRDIYADAFGWSSIGTVDISSYRPALNSIDQLYQNLGSCTDSVMVLDGLFHDTVTRKIPETFWQSLWTAMFTPTPLVKHLTKMARRAMIADYLFHKDLSEYGCLHVRLGDFSGVCGAPRNSAPWLKNLYNAGHKCNVSLDAIADRTKSLGVDKFLIISDEPEKLAPLLTGFPTGSVWTGADVRALVEEVLPKIRPYPSAQMIHVFSALTEQHLCAGADRVILNSFSTFSRSVHRYTEGKNNVEWW